MNEASRSSIIEAYGGHYGDSLEELLLALSQEGKKVARWNKYVEEPAIGLGEALEWAPKSYEQFPQGAPERAENGLLKWYVMDAASLLPALALDVRPGMSVVDMCAAPGGKSLVIAEQLDGQGELTLNDMSAGRRARLRRVVEGYLPVSVREMIRLTGHDASRWGLVRPESADRVLLDAPCSGERYGVNDESWSAKRSKMLAKRQFGLICSALLTLKPGGQLVYSTCSISPFENDRVVERLLKKKDGVELVSFDSPIGEATDFGWFIRPDRHRYGPIYYSVLRKF